MLTTEQTAPKTESNPEQQRHSIAEHGKRISQGARELATRIATKFKRGGQADRVNPDEVLQEIATPLTADTAPKAQEVKSLSKESAFEQFRQDRNWENRKKEMRKQFQESGMSDEDAEKAIGVVAFLEGKSVYTTIDQYPKNGKEKFVDIPYQYAKTDLESIKKLTEGVEKPIDLLKQLEQVIDIHQLGYLSADGSFEDKFLGKLASYMDGIKNNKRLNDLLPKIAVIGALYKVHPDNLPEPDGTSPDRRTRNPLHDLLTLPQIEYDQLLSSENIERLGIFNKQLVKQCQEYSTRNKIDASIGGIRAEALFDFLKFSHNATGMSLFQEMYSYEISRVSDWNDSESLHKSIRQYQELVDSVPELLALYEAGFGVWFWVRSNSPWMTMPGDKDWEQVIVKCKQNREDFQKILRNGWLCANAKILKTHGFVMPTHPHLELLQKADGWKEIAQDSYYIQEAVQFDFVRDAKPEKLEKALYIWEQAGDGMKWWYDNNPAKPQPVYRYSLAELYKKVWELTNNLDPIPLNYIRTAFEITQENTGPEKSDNSSNSSTAGYEIVKTIAWLAWTKKDDPTFNISEYLDKDIIYTQKFAELLIQDKRYDDLDHLLTDKALASMNDNDRQYWHYWKKIKNQEIRDILLSSPEQFSQWVTNGEANLSFVDFLVNAGQTGRLKYVLTDQALANMEDKQRNFWELWKETTNPLTQDFIIKNRDTMDIEKLRTYVDISNRISNCPSQEVQRIKDQIINSLLEVEDPLKAYAQIEAIFIKNNLPLAEKVYKIFDVLHPEPVLTSELNNLNLSPVLRHASDRDRRYIINQDLIDVHINSGNRSLRDYIQVLSGGEGLLKRFDEGGLSSLSDEEKRKFGIFLNKMDTLYKNSFLGKMISAQVPENTDTNVSLEERVNIFRQRLGLNEGEKISTSLSEAFLQPLKYQSYDEISEQMRQAKEKANERGYKYANQSPDGYLSFQAGALIKGVDEKYIENIMQNGSVAKEYLGSAASSDTTPFDTDTSLVLPADLENKTGLEQFQQVLANSIGGRTGGYGNLLFVVKDREQLYQTSKENYVNQLGKYELFFSGFVEKRHYGVRTGFPCTEVDFMVALSPLRNNSKDLNKVYYSIAQNGYYVPIADSTGKIIFTPQMYEDLRHTFDGLDAFEGNTLTIDKTANDKRISELAVQLREDAERVNNLTNQIHTTVQEVLQTNEIQFRDDETTGIIGAELYDIGSTGRHTNVKGDSDFDMTLVLDDKDTGKIEVIRRQLIEKLKAKQDAINAYTRSNGSQQLQFKEVLIGDTPVAIDIGFAKKSDLRVFASHDAVSGKLQWIRDNLGEDTYYQVIANVVLAKEVLKAGKAYKKEGEGGLGGIGVENWILANGGNFQRACESFVKASYDENGQKRSFDDFKAHYKIYDPGVNILYMGHDEFIDRNLKENGYQNMLETVKKYLHQVNTNPKR